MPRDLASARADDNVEAFVPPLAPINIKNFLARDFPPREQLLSPWLPAKGLSMVFAPRGVGKTHFALAVAYAVASGSGFLKWAAPKPRRVFLLDGEMPAAALQERWREIVKAGATEGIDIEDEDAIRILSADLCEFGIPDLSTEAGQKQLEPLLGDADLIVVDNLSTICRSGKENESESWGSVQAWALAQRRAGRSVLFVHHAGKGGEQRGTSKREDVMDSVVKLSHPDDYTPEDGARFSISFTKSRGFFGRDAESFEASMRDGRWTWKDIADALIVQARMMAAEGMTQRQIAKELGCSAAKVNRMLAKKEDA